MYITLLTFKYVSSIIIDINFEQQITKRKTKGGYFMKKKNIIIFLVAVFVCIMLGWLYSTNHRLSKLETIVKEQEETSTKQAEKEENEQAKEIQQEVVQERQTGQLEGEYDTFDDYMKIIFPTDGKYYVEATGTVQFYADPDCTVEINSPRFLSKKIEYRPNFNSKSGYGISIYVFLMEEEKICYCPAYINGQPSLIEED